MRRSSDELGELLEQLRLALGADETLLHLALVEDEERRDAHDVVATRDVRVVVDVELRDLDATGVLLGDVLEHGGDHLAGPAPLGPEVDEYRRVSAADTFVEGRIGESH